MKSLLILGAGGFGRMIKETALALGYEEVLFLDDTAKDDDVIGRCCDYHLYHRDYSVAVAAFGNNKTRLFWTQKLLEEEYDRTSICNRQSECSLRAGLFYYAKSSGKYEYNNQNGSTY